MKRNILFISVAILFLLGSFLFGYLFASKDLESTPNNDLTPIEKCIQEKREKFGSPSHYDKGIITINFKDSVTPKEAEAIILKYSLEDFEARRYGVSYHISVPEDSELQWVCIFEGEEIVDYGVVNFILEIA